jgi:hypothetical protein
MVVAHLCRSLRWNYLLAPLGIRIPPGPLLAISSVGFMAILALPARLGELVRPGLLRRRGISASAALGTVAVERIIDGLMISLLVFVAFFALRGPESPGWMMPTAYGALAIFAAALVVLLFAMQRPEATARVCVKISLLDRFWPKVAKIIEAKLLDMFSGFAVLRDTPNLLKFCFWTMIYWSANGLTVYVLAQAFELELSLVGGFAVMASSGSDVADSGTSVSSVVHASRVSRTSAEVMKECAVVGTRRHGAAIVHHLFRCLVRRDGRARTGVAVGVDQRSARHPRETARAGDMNVVVRALKNPGWQLVLGGLVLALAFPSRVSGSIGLMIVTGGIGVAVMRLWPHVPPWMRSPGELTTTAVVTSLVVAFGVSTFWDTLTVSPDWQQ